MELKEFSVATILTWVAVIGLMNGVEPSDSLAPENRPVLLVEDETSAPSPFARERSSFVPPWRERDQLPDSRLPIPSGNSSAPHCQ